MAVSYDCTGTLRAQEHGHPPLICFEPRSPDGVPRIVSGDVSPTLNTCGGGRDSHVSASVILIEMTSTKNTIVTDEICPTLTGRMGTGGNQVNAVLQTGEIC